MYWTAQNTEGFTAADLDTLNAAQDALQDAAPGIDPANVADLINNAWRPGITAADLIAAARQRMG